MLLIPVLNITMQAVTTLKVQYPLSYWKPLLVILLARFVTLPHYSQNWGSDRTSSGETNRVPSYTYPPPVAENGDIRAADNDGDGRAETVYVRGYYRKDGTYVRGHYRARPRR